MADSNELAGALAQMQQQQGPATVNPNMLAQALKMQQARAVPASVMSPGYNDWKAVQDRQERDNVVMSMATAVAPFAGPAVRALKAWEPSVPGALSAQRGAITWHGSPHKFDAFDTSKIGTGEGAQAYGHGIYLAENPGVARYYKDNITMQKSGQVIVDGKPATSEMYDATGGRLRSNDASLQQQIDELQKKAAKEQSRKQPNEELINNLKTWQSNLESYRGKVSTYQPNLYKVDLPDEHIAKMLDWDKPLSQQPQSVRDALAKIDKDFWHPSGGDYDASELGQSIYHRIAASGKTFAEASEKLRQAGVPGIKYLDAGSRGAGTGTRNFVIFDGNTAKILGRN